MTCVSGSLATTFKTLHVLVLCMLFTLSVLRAL